MPKIKVAHHVNIKGFAEAQVTNQTQENLICHIAIDGYKVLFQLSENASSQWFTASDVNTNHTHFSIWCDYLSLHPKYQNN